MIFPEQYRHVHPVVTFVAGDPDGGFFMVPHYDLTGYFFNCLANDSRDWQHVAFTLSESNKMSERCPTWEETCFIKSLFWTEEETAMQVHPRKSEYINNHPYCLHLFKPKYVEIPLPPSIMIGVKQLNITRKLLPI